MSIKAKARHTPPKSASPFSILRPERTAISVAGRRVILHALDHKADLFINDALESEDPVEVTASFSRIVRHFCEFPDHGGKLSKQDYASTIQLSEESDLLYLLRWASMPTTVAPFQYPCSSCKGHVTALQIELRRFPRKLFVCSDEECVCHEINLEMFELLSEDDSSWDNIAWMQERWSEVPSDHLEVSPPALTFSPDSHLRGLYNSMIDDLTIEGRIPTAADRTAPVVGKSKRKLRAMSNGVMALSETLLPFVSAISWPSQGIVNEERPPYVKKYLQEMPRPILIDFDTFVVKSQGGIDHSINASCGMCGRGVRTMFPFDQRFILPMSTTDNPSEQEAPTEGLET